MTSIIFSFSGLAKRRKTVDFLRGGFFIFLSASLLAYTSGTAPGNAAGQDQPKKPEFYALQIVCEKEVQNARDCLGAPDGRCAEILPGGELVLLMENRLYSFPIGGGTGESIVFLDSGSVVGKGGADFSLDGWFAWRDGEDKERHDWITLGMSASGFCLPLVGSLSPSDFSAGTDMIRITNRGAKSLFVDAVIGYDWDIYKKQKS
jgi:hypothetical protein